MTHDQADKHKLQVPYETIRFAIIPSSHATEPAFTDLSTHTLKLIRNPRETSKLFRQLLLSSVSIATSFSVSK